MALPFGGADAAGLIDSAAAAHTRDKCVSAGGCGSNVMAYSTPSSSRTAATATRLRLGHDALAALQQSSLPLSLTHAGRPLQTQSYLTSYLWQCWLSELSRRCVACVTTIEFAPLVAFA